MYGEIKIFAGTAIPEVAQGIANYLNISCSGMDIIEFPNENLWVRLHNSVRGQDVYLIQNTSRPVHRNLMELLITLQTLRLDSAGRVTAVIPYLSYTRSDKKDKPRVPITARLVADMIEIAGADRYMTMDMHAGQIQGFFSIPGDVLTAYHILKDRINALLPKMKDPVVLTVDLGFAKKGRNLAVELGVPIAFIEKRRKKKTNSAEALSLIGEIGDRDVIIIDDEVDTGGSMAEAAFLAQKNGARDICAVFVHPVFSDPAVERLAASPITHLITTNTIPVSPGEIKKLQKGRKVEILDISPLLGEVIRRAHEGRSVGELFDE
ncbi:MAG TPA: ribose-phosphate diphosphokinase [Chloroflexi bacterium]|nr:MAG: ribose-phosphate diphosphokinase [Chloroflexota bacterium]HDD56002.1 ribose-phosphate diphosphokinase [Chloroflexota bacterium]